MPAPTLDTTERRRFEAGNSLFNQTWVAGQSPTDTRDGLGPLLNAASCSSCHVLDGRAAPPRAGAGPAPGLFLRIGVERDGVVTGHPTYGLQIQDRAIDGIPAEATILIEHEATEGTYRDGTGYILERPLFGLADFGYGQPGPLLVSPRIAPAVVGMGLLEAIPDAEILANADPDDRDADGISGRPNFVRSSASGTDRLGRFGWKASTASLTDQVAQAFIRDIGITSTVFPEQSCTENQVACRSASNDGSPELSAERLDDVVFYMAALAVPERRRLDDESVTRGAGLFLDLGCASCHIPTFTTGDHPVDAIANQVIHPFTDLLLHDMGPGLADGAPDGLANGSEWRTAPLWGLGLLETVNGHTNLLHDGRARSVEEAILWHGGEAEPARRRFAALDSEDRDRVVAFLESL